MTEKSRTDIRVNWQLDNSDAMTEKRWKDMRRRWEAHLYDLPRNDLHDIIRMVIETPGAFLAAFLLDALRLRFDAPDLVFDYLDEHRSMDNAGDTPPAAYEAWGERARAALRQYIGDEPANAAPVN